MSTLLGNRYELIERIGDGGMAEVYRAHDKMLDRFVAVKILHPQFTSDEAFVKRFRREAQGAAKLSHPNIVSIYDVGDCDGKYYIVMEYVKGETLKDKIEKDIYDVFLSKIGRLNERPNAQKLETPFTELGIELDEDEKYCLSCRNLLLHGTLPKPKGDFYKMLNEKELIKIVSNRLIMLSAMLLLKKVGYEYKIVDWGYTEVSKLRAILMGESISRAGNAFRTIK